MSVLYFAAWNTHWAAAVGAEEDLRRRETPVSFLTSLQGKWKTGTQRRQARQWPGGCPGSIRGSSKGKSGRCQKAMAPVAGVRGGTGKGRSSERADSPGARETSPCRRVPQVRAPVLGQSGVNAGGSRPQRGWSQSSSGLTCPPWPPGPGLHPWRPAAAGAGAAAAHLPRSFCSCTTDSTACAGNERRGGQNRLHRARGNDVEPSDGEACRPRPF